jgi:hypothetical protein
MNKLFRDVIEWFKTNLLSLNLKKLITYNLGIRMFGELMYVSVMITSNINYISGIKFQRLIIDEMLSWKNLINQLMSMLNSACYAVRAVNAITSQKTSRKISFSCIHCVMVNVLAPELFFF